MTISKELLEAVKGYTVNEVLPHPNYDLKDSHIQVKYFLEEGFGTDYISINNFFFECKEWAFTNIDLIPRAEYGYICYMHSGKEADKEYKCILEYSAVSATETFYATSEQQAVFNACQWLLDNKEMT